MPYLTVNNGIYVCTDLVNLSCPEIHDVAFQNFRLLQVIVLLCHKLYYIININKHIFYLFLFFVF